MKNIHVLPTDKPSSLYLGNNGNFVFGMIQTSIQSRNDDFTNQHLYITSDEEIKDGEWCLLNNRLVVRYFKPPVESKSFKKIILTTDKDLIKDGVQAIDDEFLEWFVKNPSCERVDIETMMECEKCGKEHCDNLQCRGYKDIPYYKIIIPKEEPKQETLEYDLLQHIKFCLECKNDSQAIRLIEKYGFEKQEGKYSEEEVMDMFHNLSMHLPLHYEFLVKEQFKKK